MKPLSTAPVEEFQEIRYVLTDIDDTLTKEGKLMPEAYSAIWELFGLGINVIPVTGRSAGWCDMIMTQWPVTAVIGENGAFAFIKEEETYRLLSHPLVNNTEPRKALKRIERAVLSSVPSSRVTRDQFSRLFDLAIDYAETSPKLSLKDAGRIKKQAEALGASAKISSIHVNIWFGDYDKLSMVLYLLLNYWNVNKTRLMKEVVYCGDSPNDEPMFAYFPLSVGVGNIRQYRSFIQDLPAYVTSRMFGDGFAEFVSFLKNEVLQGC